MYFGASGSLRRDVLSAGPVILVSENNIKSKKLTFCGV